MANGTGIDWQGLIGMGGLILSAATAPKPPKIEAFVAPETPERKLEDFAPYLPVMESMQADTALRMMSGELPKAVEDQIKTTVGEAALRGGYGASESRTRNVLARDLGLAQMNVIQQGYAMSNQLISRAQGRLADAYAGDTAMVNQAYDAWAFNTQQRMDRYRAKAERNANYVEQLTSVAAQSAQRSNLRRQEQESNRRFDEAMARSDALRSEINTLTNNMYKPQTSYIPPSFSMPYTNYNPGQPYTMNVPYYMESK